MTQTVVKAEKLSKVLKVGEVTVHALRDVSMQVEKGIIEL